MGMVDEVLIRGEGFALSNDFCCSSPLTLVVLLCFDGDPDCELLLLLTTTAAAEEVAFNPFTFPAAASLLAPFLRRNIFLKNPIC